MRVKLKAYTELACLPSRARSISMIEIMSLGSRADVHAKFVCSVLSSAVLNLSYLFMLTEIMCACSFQGPPGGQKCDLR